MEDSKGAQASVIFPVSLDPPPRIEGSIHAESTRRLSIGTASATPLPPSPARDAFTTRSFSTQRSVSSSSTGASSRAYLRRSSTSSSTNNNNEQRRSPTLSKKTSLSSSQGLREARSPRPSPKYSSTIKERSSSFTEMPFTSPLSSAGDTLKARPQTTPASHAKARFVEELKAHGSYKSYELKTDTVVILHDSCYGHRYSRPRTSRANLNTIVERPERLHAAALGVAAAYVRLGGRHSEGAHSLGPGKDSKLPSDIPFHIQRSSRSIPLTSAVVANIHGAKWMTELKLMCQSAEAKLALDGKELNRPAEVNGDETDGPKFHEGDLYLCGQSLEALEGTLGAVCDAVDTVFQGGNATDGTTKAFVCVRPPGHHCSSSYPSGFCWLNNVHVGISYAAQTYGLTHVAIIDFDLHHGDGSQSITWAHNAKLARLPKNASGLKRAPIGYFSLHDINSYPCEMGDEDKVRNASICVENAHGQSIWNVHLQPWKTEDEFWDLYESRYSILIDKAKDFLRIHTQRLRAASAQSKPKAAIFLSAGFDASEWEGAGMQRHKVNVPTSFYARFTQDVVNMASEEDLAVDGRVISVLEGGYSDRALSSGILSHLSGLTRSSPVIKDELADEQGLGYEMGRRIGRVKDDVASRMPLIIDSLVYDPAWWSLPQLERLEALVNPAPPPPPGRRPRVGTPPTYTSTTQSFMAKVVPTAKTYRSISGFTANGYASSPASVTSRAPTPPLPEVDWATAAHELSKLLIPSDRPTLSCKPEELTTEASRGRKPRHSTVGVPEISEPVDAGRRVLRDRKGRTPNYVLLNEGLEEPAALPLPIKRSDRRRTVAAPGLVQDPVAGRGTRAVAVGRAQALSSTSRRRSSAGSSIASTGGDVVNRLPTQAVNHSSMVAQGAVELPVPWTDLKLSGPSKAERKPRVSQAPRVPAGRARAGKKTSVDPSPSSPIEAPAGPDARKAPTPLASSPVLGSFPAVQASQGDHGQATDVDTDMDQLTSGLVRIKLNVPSREEYEARRLGQS
ncbi:MAG: hypothetical protein M1816_000025 [Peltula sp. TS41687]|nr:MAG: hypothetical protein M1816_000025 [Peltula sp. TS41687]